ncbi:proline dehydrogenase family protein [Aeromicrobium sp. CF4.19]|uniref:proline dehydrogenase family protein n=1 Tax=Aeromicrobium sp. CF4.19 TaxID=3373082 RepID=UPI003EE7CBBE
MASNTPTTLTRTDDLPLADETITLVQRWVSEAAKEPADKAATRLAGVLKDPRGLPFTVGFIDGVIRPEDDAVAARNFAVLARDVPEFLPFHLRAAVALGSRAGLLAPRLVVPIVRRALRSMVGHLIIDATASRIGRSIARIGRHGAALNLNLLGEAVLGEREADRRLDGTLRLLARDDVDYVSIKVSSTVAPHSPWAFDEAVTGVVAKLTPLYEIAAAASERKFVNLDMEEYRDLDLTMEVFTRILDKPEFLELEAGIVLQAYLPDAMAAMIRLQEWAAERRRRGGAAIKVRIVKGANLPMEQVEASLHDWPLATWPSKQESDTNYKRVLDYALRPARIENVRIGVAGHNLFDLAYAWLLAGERGVRQDMEIEMLLGMAQGQAAVIRREVGHLLLYTPVVRPQEFDVAIAYLIRRLEEGASHENFMSAVFELHEDDTLFARERDRFLASLRALDGTVPAPRRTQDRTAVPETLSTKFANTPDTDPSLPANRAWARDIVARIADSDLGRSGTAEHTVSDAAALNRIVVSAAEHGQTWGRTTGEHRAAILHRVAETLQARRAELAEVMASETGKTLDQSDPEISEAIDFARYYAARALELHAIDGATFVPSALTVVTPPWNFPVAIPAGSTLAALAAGSAVILKPAVQAARCGTLVAEVLWEAGVPRDVLQLVHVDEGALGRELIAHPSVDRVILTGAYETAELFRTFRSDLPLLAETSGKNAIVVTPSADLDLAAKDVAYSAFGHAGQKCSAASLVILVGSAARSRRFRDQLIDAVGSLTVGYPQDPTTQMGPIVEPATGKLLDALTTIDPGERWVLEPEQLDETGRLWSPGVVDHVTRGSRRHLTEFFGPVLGIMTARDLDEAIEIQNEVDYGLTAGLHTLEPTQLATWLDRVEAGNLYVNRGITGAIVQRQPFGGWKKSAVGTGFKAGGPNYLLGLGDWVSAEHPPLERVLDPSVMQLLQLLPADEVERVRRSFLSDARAWEEEFGRTRDVSELSAERNIFRYLPTKVEVRLAREGNPADLVRVIGTARRAGASPHVSSAVPLSPEIERAVGEVTVESDDLWIDGLLARPVGRVRLIAADATAVAQRLASRPDIALHASPVTESGRLEMLPFLREQAISITAHRFGTPDELSRGIL